MHLKNSLLLMLICMACCSQWSHAQGSKKGLVAQYLFNADAQDVSGNNNDGYIKGGVFTTRDRFGNACGAMQFNGTDGYIHVPHSPSLSQPQSAYTIALWFKASDGSEYSDLQWMTICCKSNSREESSNSPQFRLQSTRYTVSMNTEFTENFDHQIKFDTWYHYAVTYDGDYCRVYLNNKEIVSWQYNTSFSPNQLAMEIGRDLPGNIEYFCGVMDELYIYDRALSPREVTALYTNESERTSKKPCGPPPVVTPKKKNNPQQQQSPAVTQQQVATNVPNQQQTPCANAPLIVNEDTIEYQQTIVVDNPNVRLLFYDAEKEDGDIVSVNFNGAWVLERYYLKKKTTQKPRQLNLTLIPNFENYIFTKAWNLGSIPPNTLTVEIIEINSNKPPKIVNIKSNIGRSGAIKLVYQP